MAKFIEVEPLVNVVKKSRMLINVEKIDYVRERDGDITEVFLKDVPLDGWFDKPAFRNPLEVTTPFIFLVDAIQGKNGEE